VKGVRNVGDDEKPEAEGQGANPPLFGKGDAKPKP